MDRIRVLCWLASLLISYPLTLCAQNQLNRAQSPREFVEGFYNWYVAAVVRENGTRDVALKYRSSSFSRELARLLKEDYDAQRSCEELIGIDFDPYLGSNDPAEHYDVGEISRKGEYYCADVYRVESGRRAAKPDVQAEFLQSDGRWIFVNFLYPEDHSDLLKILVAPRDKCTVPRSAQKPPQFPARTTSGVPQSLRPR